MSSQSWKPDCGIIFTTTLGIEAAQSSAWLEKNLYVYQRQSKTCCPLSVKTCYSLLAKTCCLLTDKTYYSLSIKIYDSYETTCFQNEIESGTGSHLQEKA